MTERTARVERTLYWVIMGIAGLLYVVGIMSGYTAKKEQAPRPPAPEPVDRGQQRLQAIVQRTAMAAQACVGGGGVPVFREWEAVATVEGCLYPPAPAPVPCAIVAGTETKGGK